MGGRGEEPLPYTGDGKLINSNGNGLELNGLSVPEAQKAAIEYVDKKGFGVKKINFKLRDWLFRCTLS